MGRTLVKDREGRWVIRHGPGDYKVRRGWAHGLPAFLAASLLSLVSFAPLQTGRAYGERPPLVLSPHIYPELEAFMGRWRAELKPAHNLLFTQ